jgi:hypothetical protein
LVQGYALFGAWGNTQRYEPRRQQIPFGNGNKSTTAQATADPLRGGQPKKQDNGNNGMFQGMQQMELFCPLSKRYAVTLQF